MPEYNQVVAEYNTRKLALFRPDPVEQSVAASRNGTNGYINSRNINVLYSDANVPLKEGSHTFYAGNCTRYVASKVTVPWRGDAKEWMNNASGMGYDVKDVPDEGDIFVTDESAYGHVGIVKEIDYEKGVIKVEEMNYKGYGVISEREIELSSTRLKGFIDPDKEEQVEEGESELAMAETEEESEPESVPVANEPADTQTEVSEETTIEEKPQPEEHTEA